MVVIDTNIVIRFLTDDDPEQAARTRKLVTSDQITLLMTVALEAHWVLRKGYGYSAKEAAEKLRDFAGLPGVTIEDDFRLYQALELTEAGMDFADALHLASVETGNTFATFDADLVKSAKRMQGIDVRQL